MHSDLPSGVDIEIKIVVNSRSIGARRPACSLYGGRPSRPSRSDRQAQMAELNRIAGS